MPVHGFRGLTEAQVAQPAMVVHCTKRVTAVKHAAQDQAVLSPLILPNQLCWCGGFTAHSMYSCVCDWPLLLPSCRIVQQLTQFDLTHLQAPSPSVGGPWMRSGSCSASSPSCCQHQQATCLQAQMEAATRYILDLAPSCQQLL